MTSRKVVFLLVIWLGGSGALAHVPVNPRDAHPWDYLVRELESKGVATDVDSVIQAALSHPDLNVRWMAANLLGQRGDEEAEEALRVILADDESRLVRQTAAVALVRLGHSEILKAVRRFMRTEETWSQRLKLAADLASVGDFSGYDLVVEASQADDVRLRRESVGTVRIFLSGGFSGEAAPSPQEVLLHLLTDESPEVRSRALRHISIAHSQGVSLEPYLDPPVALEKLCKTRSGQEARGFRRL